MVEKTKTKKSSAETEKKRAEKTSEKREPAEKSYYYDDAHGYEIYQPEINDEENNEHQ